MAELVPEIDVLDVFMHQVYDQRRNELIAKQQVKPEKLSLAERIEACNSMMDLNALNWIISVNCVTYFK